MKCRAIKKEIFHFTLILVLMLSLTTAVFAAGQGPYSEGTLYYTVSEGSITITGCFGMDSTVTVPASIAGYPVNTIAAGAFTENRFITEVILPDTVTSIESGAFADGIQVKFAGSGSIDDIKALARHVAGIELITDHSRLQKADTNHDGQINAADLTKLAGTVLEN